jgi:hypothetical protein
MTSQPEHRRERGFTFIMHSITLIGTIGAVGLVVDEGSFLRDQGQVNRAPIALASPDSRRESSGPFPSPDPDDSSGSLMIASVREHLRDSRRRS